MHYNHKHKYSKYDTQRGKCTVIPNVRLHREIHKRKKSYGNL